MSSIAWSQDGDLGRSLEPADSGKHPIHANPSPGGGVVIDPFAPGGRAFDGLVSIVGRPP